MVIHTKKWSTNCKANSYSICVNSIDQIQVLVLYAHEFCLFVYGQ